MNNSEVTYPDCIKWLPSVKALSFKCNKCGTQLWDMDEATEELELENKPLDEEPVGRCRTCGNIVARIVGKENE